MKQRSFSLSGGILLLVAGILFGAAAIIGMGDLRVNIRWDITLPILAGLAAIYLAVNDLKR